MNKEEAKNILAAYRPDDQDRADPVFADALEEAGRDAELDRWFSEERQFDRAVANHLSSIPMPFGLKTRILANGAQRTTRWPWVAALLGAALLVLVSSIGFWQRSAPPSVALAQYQEEMMSFVKLQPPLEMESPTIGPIRQWLVAHKAPLTDMPKGIAAGETMGCRILSFRGHEVTLICFCHGKTVAHLFIVDRAALPAVRSNSAPEFRRENNWTVATWANKQYACMVAVQGNESETERYLPHA